MHSTIKHLTLGLAILGSASLAGGLPAHAAPPYGSATIQNSPCLPNPASPCISAEQGLTIASDGVSPLDSLVISGIARQAPGPMVLTFADDGTNTVFYSATMTSTAMVGDYAGYSQFRFAVPDYLLGSRPTWVDVTVSQRNAITFDKLRRTAIWPSNVVQIEGQTRHVRTSCHYTPYWNAADGSEYLDGVDISGHDLQPGTGVSVSILAGFDVNPADPRTTLWGPASATTSSAAHPTFSVHVPQDVVGRLAGVPFQIAVSYAGRDGTYALGPFTGFACAPIYTPDSGTTVTKP